MKKSLFILSLLLIAIGFTACPKTTESEVVRDCRVAFDLSQAELVSGEKLKNRYGNAISEAEEEKCALTLDDSDTAFYGYVFIFDSITEAMVAKQAGQFVLLECTDGTSWWWGNENNPRKIRQFYRNCLFKDESYFSTSYIDTEAEPAVDVYHLSGADQFSESDFNNSRYREGFKALKPVGVFMGENTAYIYEYDGYRVNAWISSNGNMWMSWSIPNSSWEYNGVANRFTDGIDHNMGCVFETIITYNEKDVIFAYASYKGKKQLWVRDYGTEGFNRYLKENFDPRIYEIDLGKVPWNGGKFHILDNSEYGKAGESTRQGLLSLTHVVYRNRPQAGDIIHVTGKIVSKYDIDKLYVFPVDDSQNANWWNNLITGEDGSDIKYTIEGITAGEEKEIDLYFTLTRGVYQDYNDGEGTFNLCFAYGEQNGDPQTLLLK